MATKPTDSRNEWTCQFGSLSELLRHWQRVPMESREWIAKVVRESEHDELKRFIERMMKG